MSDETGETEMGIGMFILDGHKPVAESDVVTWGEFMGKASRHVAQDAIGESRVSTVFLGLDHSDRPGDVPVLFETMVFGGPMDGEQWRYETWGEAAAGHAKVLADVTAKAAS